MLNFQKEIERILKQAGDYPSFRLDEEFSKIFRISDVLLEVSKTKDAIAIIIGSARFEFLSLPYNLAWYPIQVIEGDEVISIVINYENGRAYSARNWLDFWDKAEEVAKNITDTDPETLVLEHKQIAEGIAFEQMSLWL
ncbi:hypothetical protein Desaci_4130 [Desulfosporosinus acidiphilus SJ4]|uniref:Uncharacterized protein n=1 Tax=Desulfosporosinus acidiphilus (strain DSM 22704 / JCM 16185 / SJ4) TaxID=646529 RepID=I4DB18_DESAJ|nr:hypothetical protein [Desulfosporosinus acidiphilus]AFM42992.1 hypothetical protein Desaci_4130 [Desulfosporosinus acidiphilus SJ4]